MSIQFNHNAPITRKPQMHSQPLFRNPHRHSLGGASTLTVGAAPISCLDRLKTWFASICSWFKNLFSRNPSANALNPATANPGVNTPAPPHRLGHLTNATPFKKDDYDYTGYTKLQTLNFAEHGCAFPKLALYLVESGQMDVIDAVTKINMALQKAPSSTTLTAKFVLDNS